MTTVKDVLEMCKIVIDGLILAGQAGISYRPATMIELSNHISDAISQLENEKYCSCSTVVIKDGVHCENCGLVYKSRRHD